MMFWKRVVLACAVLLMSTAMPTATQAKNTTYQTGFVRWRAADNGFAAWELSGTTRTRTGAISLGANPSAGNDPYPAGSYNGQNFYNGGSFVVGEATSPAIAPANIASFKQVIASWNAETPPGTWIETRIRASFANRWSKWYNLGVWAADTGTVARHSVKNQGDNDATVATDTLLITNKKQQLEAVQLNVRLFSANNARPIVHSLALAFSSTPTGPSETSSGNPKNWNTLIDIPACSQMVYPDGGEVWCSPTSTSMVVGHWAADAGPCEPRVRAAVAGVHDWMYGGYGNWSFNAAYAATQGLEGYVARFNSLNDVEQWVAAGVPVVFSFGWGRGELTGADYASSRGHLAVIVGFDKRGNPIVHDPATASNSTVRRTYLRSELEALWLAHSGGTVYLIYPIGHATATFE